MKIRYLPKDGALLWNEEIQRIAVPATSTLPALGEYVTERAGEALLLADEKQIGLGASWHAFNVLSHLNGTPWLLVLAQYGVRHFSYLGYANTSFPVNATGDDIASIVKPYLATDRLVVALTGPNVQGFLTDGWAAYHTWDGQGGAWALCPYQASGPAFGQPNTLLIAMTHEVGEWLTDPDGRGYPEDGSFNEVGDRCNWQPSPLSVNGYNYLITKQWDAARGVCGP